MQAVGLLSNYISQGVYTVAAPFHPFGGAVDIIVVQQEDGTFKSTPWYVKFGKFQGVLKRREKIVTVSVNGREADFHMYLDHKGEAFFWKEVEPEEDETIFSPPSAPSSSDEAALPGHGGRRISFNEDNSSGGTDDARKEGTAAGDGGDETALSEPACLENGGVCRNTEEILISSSERSPGSAEKQQGESKNPNGDCCSMPLSADAKSSVKNGKTLSKTPSRTSKSIFSLVFRGKSQSFSEPQISVAVTDEKGREGETDDFRRSSLERAERVADLLDKKWATGDCANREEEMGRISSELACHSDSSRFDASLNTGCSQQPEIGINSDGVVCSSLLPSDEQVTSVVDTISGGATNGNSAGVCNHLEASTMEHLGGSIEKQGHSIQETDSERWYLESETGTFIVEDSSGKYNESRQQISKNVVARLSGRSLLLESVSGMGETTGRSADVILTSVDNGQDAIAAPVSSLDVHSGGSDIGETRLDLVADPDLIIQSAERIRSIQQVIEVPIEPITEGSDENEHKLLKHGGKQDKEDGIHVFPQKELDESSLCDGNTSVNSRLADHKFAPVEAFSQTSKQEDTGAVDFHNQLVESEANNVPQGNLQMQFYSSISESVSDLEGERKQIGQLVDEVHEPGFALQNNNDYGELDECCIQEKRTYANDMSRSECGKEFELTLNNDYNFKTCLPVSDPIPPPEKEKRQHIASLTMEEEGREYRLNEIDKTSEESALSSNHHGQSKALQTVSAHVLESSLQNSDDNSSKLSRSQTSPINITAVYIKGRVDDSLQVSGSLPNMGLHTEKEGADHVFSHSLDFGSVCLKRGMSHDIFFPNSENMESNVFEKDTMQGWTATETSTESWSTAETAIASVQPETGIEISLCRHLLLEGMGIEAANQAFDSERVSMEDFHSSGATMVKNEKLVVRIGGQYLPWDAAAPIILGMVAFGLECPVKPEGAISVERVEKTLGKYASDSLVPSSGGWRLWPFTFRRLKTPERSNSARPASKDDLMANSDAALQSSFNGTLVVKNGYHRRAGKGKVRSNTPTSEQLLSLHLKEGQNIITFTFSTRVLGKQQVDARIYLWKWNTRIVVSDVDGTITKSDVLGQFMPLVGKDWTQSGVAHLFSAIKDNGYQLLFLSARAIAQAYLTRQFLVNIKQDGKVLPDGPVVMSPDGLFPSLYREVIRRAPHEFKIACLEDIRALFPPDCNPFYAGFGNRDTDEISYLKVGIPKGKIFIINPKGEVAVNHRVDMKSYTSLHNLVNGMFPAMSSSEQEDFNSWNYWRVPLPDIDG